MGYVLQKKCRKSAEMSKNGVLEVVNDVVLAVYFGAAEDDAEAPEVEGEGDVGTLEELLPCCAGGGAAVYAADDDHGIGGELGECSEVVGGVAVDEGRGRR